MGVSVAVGVVAVVVMMIVAHAAERLPVVIDAGTSWARRRYGRAASPGAADRINQQELDLGIDAAQFIRRPVLKFRVQLRINPKQISLTLAQ